MLFDFTLFWRWINLPSSFVQCPFCSKSHNMDTKIRLVSLMLASAPKSKEAQKKQPAQTHVYHILKTLHPRSFHRCHILYHPMQHQALFDLIHVHTWLIKYAHSGVVSVWIDIFAFCPLCCVIVRMQITYDKIWYKVIKILKHTDHIFKQ